MLTWVEYKETCLKMSKIVENSSKNCTIVQITIKWFIHSVWKAWINWKNWNPRKYVKF